MCAAVESREELVQMLIEAALTILTMESRAAELQLEVEHLRHRLEVGELLGGFNKRMRVAAKRPDF